MPDKKFKWTLRTRTFFYEERKNAPVLSAFNSALANQEEKNDSENK